MTLTLLTALFLFVAVVASFISFFYFLLGVAKFIRVAKGGGMAWDIPIVDGLMTGLAAFVAIVAWVLVFA